MTSVLASQAGVSVSLATLADRVWLRGIDLDGPVAVTLGSLPAGHVAVETYAVVPNASRARYLVPLGSQRAAVACLWNYRTMRKPQRRMAETVVASMFSGSMGQRVFRDRLVVSMDERVPRADYPQWLILSHLAETLGSPQLHAGIAVRRVQPNSKPMLELFDGQGESQGYAKLAWSAATNQLVRTEAATLVALKGRLDRVIAPRLAAFDNFLGADYSVATPLPLGLRPLTVDPLATPRVTLDVAGSGTLYRRPLAGSAYAQLLRRELTAAKPAAPQAAHVLLDWLTRLEAMPAELSFGRWHGDWISHNLGSLDDRVVAWDWEHSRLDVPIGFDALHWHYQPTLFRSGLVQAVDEVTRSSRRLGGFGISPAAQELTASLYLLEMFLRAVTLAAGGGGWNPRVYPAMIGLAAARDVAPAADPSTRSRGRGPKERQDERNL